jgi:Holliday junction resolvasome RuvABC DNA-binding subunit
MYKQDRKLFDYTAKQWTQQYAVESKGDEKLNSLLEMGFPEDECKKALERYDNN